MTAELFNDNYEAKCAYQILKSTNRPIFLTGRAGTGKSTFIEWAKTITEKRLVLAPTGVAAQNIGGRTIHSVFNLPNRVIYPNDCKLFSSKKYCRENMEELFHSELIIIDEISMVNSSTMYFMDYILKTVCGSKEIFGGKKLLLVGDPLQLPPVITTSTDRADLKMYFGGEYFFDSQLFKKCDPIKIELHKIYRQKDPEHCRILNDIREGINIRQAISYLNRACLPRDSHRSSEELEYCMILTFTNTLAQGINSAWLSDLPNKEFQFHADVWGDFDIKSCSAEEVLRVKVGAHVMCTKNHTKGDYVNGTMGIVREINQNYIIIEDSKGKLITINQATWTNEQIRYKKTRDEFVEVVNISGGCKQYPIKLGWAITVHKSQGLTFDKIFLQNSGNVFANSQIYVALSRCSTIQGIELARPLKSSDIQIDKRMHIFYNNRSSREDVDGLITEIFDEIILESLPIQFTHEEIEESILRNEFFLLDNSISDLIQRMIINGWILEEGLNQYERIDQIPSFTQGKS